MVCWCDDELLQAIEEVIAERPAAAYPMTQGGYFFRHLQNLLRAFWQESIDLRGIAETSADYDADSSYPICSKRSSGISTISSYMSFLR